MKGQLNKKIIERFSRQIVLKDIGIIGQKKIISSKVLIVGAGGLGCPSAEFLTRAGVGTIGIVDNDIITLSNIHRQSLYQTSDVGKFKVNVVKEKIKFINPNTNIKTYKFRLNNLNLKKIINNYDYVIDGSDNFKTKFLLNDSCLKFKKFLVTGAISKFDGHVFTFNFKNRKIPCLRCFFQESSISDDLLNCESEGILGTVAGIIGNIQANEILKNIMCIGKNLDGFIMICDFLNLEFRKAKIKKRKNCLCK
tara:strand:- start:1574 stop:2329 length:756 start_codon:yes stop_codon:yes gene_type:complete